MKIRLNETAWRLISLYVPSLVISFGQGMAIPITPILATTFDVSVVLAAQVVTAGLLGRTFALIPSGVIVDRLGRRPAMIIGAGTLGAGSLATAVTGDFVLLLAAQFVAGIGASLWMLGREVAAADLIRPELRGRVMSAFFGISSVGSTLGPVMGGLVTDLFDFRAVFYLYGTMALAVLGMSVLIAETGGNDRPERTPLLQFGSLSEIDPYFRVTFLVLIFSTFAAFLRMTMLNSMLPLHAGTWLGFSTTEVGALFGIMGLATLVMIAPSGVVSDKLGRKAANVPAAILSALGFAAYGFATEMGQLSAISAVLGIANGFALGAMTTYTYDIVPPQARGRFQALRRTAGELGSLTGPIVGGVVAEASSPGAVFLSFAPLHLLSAFLLTFVARESLHRKR